MAVMPRVRIELTTPASSKRQLDYIITPMIIGGWALRPAFILAGLLPSGIVSTPCPMNIGPWLGIVLRII